MFTATRLKYILILSVFIGVLSIAGLTALIILWQTKLTPFQDYALVVDAGSTHSKVFLYTWPADKSDGLGLTSRVAEVKLCSVPGGAITSISDPTENNVQQYFDAAMTDCIGVIPSTRKSRTLLFLGGTAGLRLFEMKNSSYTYSLLNGTRTYFSSLGLLFKTPENQVRIISGSEEGLSGWISTNILVGELFQNNKPFETYAVSDMGGASTQISFVAPNATNDRFNMNLFNTEYDVYSHSYLCYGAEQMRNVYVGRLINQGNGSELLSDPCLQDGYIKNITYNDLFSLPCVLNRSAPSPELNTTSTYSIIGTGNFLECILAIQERLNTSVCTSETCSFDNVYQPKPIEPSLKIYAISAWYSTFNSLAPNVSLTPNKDKNYDFDSTTLTQIKAAIAAICDQPWREVVNPDNFRPLLCFNSMYHWTLFEYGYGLKNENLKNFHIVKTINSNEIGWTLGYMINQTNYLEPQYRPGRMLTQAEFIGLLFLCAFCLTASIIIVIISRYYFKRRRNY